MNQQLPNYLPEEDQREDFYDEQGNVCPNGLYDAGGHLVRSEFFDWSDFIENRFDYRK